MPPNLDQISGSPDIEPPSEHIILTLTPLTDRSVSATPSNENQSIETESNEEISIEENTDMTEMESLKNYIPLEHNIRELLVRVSNTEQLETITQIKLRVIARELALQQLGNYLPALRELILDGSIISSLRDLGYGLRNLKILRVNRCDLSCIDGVLGFENLEELYATDNAIKDLSPCAFLSSLRIIDVRRNAITHICSVSFLNLCPDLSHLLLDGNKVVNLMPSCRILIGRILPELKLLDNLPIERNECLTASTDDIIVEELDDSSDERYIHELPEREIFISRRLAAYPRHAPRNREETNTFTVRFPPKVYGNCNTGNSS